MEGGGGAWWRVFIATAALCVATAALCQGTAEEGVAEGGREEGRVFVMSERRDVVKTEAGEMKVMRTSYGGFEKQSVEIGFISMQPHSLFLPHYLDASLILFVRIGEAKVGSIYKELVEKTLKAGDVYTIPAGTLFYLINSGEGQTLDIICCIHSPQPASHNQHLLHQFQGSMMAPHMNPKAREYGVVLGGRGRVEVAFPNGTGVEAAVEEGEVFFIPRFFPFAQVASLTGPMQILGFTTSSRRNHPQFLAGRTSLFTATASPVLAAAFGVGEERFQRTAAAQGESFILPSEFAAPALASHAAADMLFI